MSNFELLHPSLQHHIVNSLGWRELRPFQEALIPEVLGGKHLVVLAPTAGGKTEAAFLPVLSRMLSEDWDALSVLYICPIKALLNNLDTRLQRYCDLVGRKSAMWHGDVRPAARKRLLANPPDCLLTTPESIEVMLVSASVDSRHWFRNIRAVIVDEVHAFAGDDRGWHLLSVLERVSRLAGRELQRIGLSATVGNPDELIDWLAGSTDGERSVSKPPQTDSSPEAEVTLDYVGDLENAATVISRMHRGDKRLVFIDSRARAEQLAAALRQREVDTYITHSSLSQDQRGQAERAFAERSNCVIVATSVLELGIDVGDLDRVIQIDAPNTVSSLLQRMGRTGRRPDTLRNCLFLCTKDVTLLQAAGLTTLWETGFIEPVQPPPAPWHVLAQQLMALTLQLRAVPQAEWFDWVGRMPGFHAMDREEVARLVAGMLDRGILWEDAGLLSMGDEGEAAFGRRHFLDLLSVFTAAPEFEVLHGRRPLGFVDQQTFVQDSKGPRVLALGGRAWLIGHIDWSRRKAYVEPVELPAKSSWRGAADIGCGFEMMRAVRSVLLGGERSPRWSRRAKDQLAEIRHEYSWLSDRGTTVVIGLEGETEWWTFGGRRANATIAGKLSGLTETDVKAGDWRITFDSSLSVADIEAAITSISQEDPASMRPAVAPAALESIKFVECLSAEMATEMLELRLLDLPAVRAIQAESVVYSTRRD